MRRSSSSRALRRTCTWAGRRASRPRPGRATPRFEELRDHVAGRMGRAPRYRQKLAPRAALDPRPGLGRRRRVRRSTATCTTAAHRDLGELVDEVMSEQLGRDRPLWELWIADELPDGRRGRDRQGAPRDGRRPRRRGARLAARGPHPRGGPVRARRLAAGADPGRREPRSPTRSRTGPARRSELARWPLEHDASTRAGWPAWRARRCRAPARSPTRCGRRPRGPASTSRSPRAATWRGHAGRWPTCG